jgi:hypothetical protein
MANTNAASGLQPYAYAWGAPWGGAVRTYYVPVGNGTALYLGDPVVLITNSSDGNGVQTAEIATAGGGAVVLGAFMGVSNNAGQTTIPVLQSQSVYLPASTAAYIYVSDDPFLLYKIQEDSVGGSMVSGASGRNADLVAGSGSTVTGLSGWQLDSSTLATTNTLQLRVIQALQETDNQVASANAKWLVKLNLSQMLAALGT